MANALSRGQFREKQREEMRDQRTSPFLLQAFMAVVITWLVVLTYHSYSSNTLAPPASRNVHLELAHEYNSGISSTRAAPHRGVFFGPNVTFLEGIATCESFKCVQEAHELPRVATTSAHSRAQPGHVAQRQFNWPHFFIAGYSKSATTSLYVYLNKHPQTNPPVTKEPAVWTNRCEYVGRKYECPHTVQRNYLTHIMKRDAFVASEGTIAQFEATPRIFDMGPEMAEILHETMPWIKIVASLREPISRAISKYHMFATKFGKGCLVNSTLSDCLKNDKDRFYGYPRKKYYSRPLAYWLDSFPTSQIKLIQYEDLIGERQAEELQGLKEFLGLDPDMTGNSLSWGLENTTKETGNVNCRHCDVPGWPMEEVVYRAMIDKVQQDTVELVRIIDKYGLGNGTRWMENWRRVWDDNLAACKNGMCEIRLS